MKETVGEVIGEVWSTLTSHTKAFESIRSKSLYNPDNAGWKFRVWQNQGIPNMTVMSVLLLGSGQGELLVFLYKSLELYVVHFHTTVFLPLRKRRWRLISV